MANPNPELADLVVGLRGYSGEPIKDPGEANPAYLAESMRTGQPLELIREAALNNARQADAQRTSGQFAQGAVSRTAERLLGGFRPGGESTHEMLGREVVPLAKGRLEGRYNEARQRYDKAQASDEDLALIARYENIQKAEQNEGTGASLGRIAAGLPKILLEATAGGKVVGLGGRALGLGRTAAAGAEAAPSLLSRAGLAGAAQQAPGVLARGAATTPFIPDMYYTDAQQRATRNGGHWLDAKNIAPAAGYAILQTAVLGHVQQIAGQSAAGLGGRVLRGGGAGFAEQQVGDVAASLVDDFLIANDAYKIGQKYGAFYRTLKGEPGAAKELMGQIATFSLFSALQGQKTATADGKPDPTAKPDLKTETLGNLLDAADEARAAARKTGMSDSTAARQLAYLTAQAGQGKSPPKVPEWAWTYQKALAESRVAPKEPVQTPPTTATEAPGRDVPPGAPDARPAGDIAAGAKPGAPVERLFRVPDYKGEAAGSVDAAVRELVGSGFAGKWFSRGKAQNESYFGPGRVQFEFDPARLAEGEAVEHGKESLLGSKTAMHEHPALAAVRYRGDAKDAGFVRLQGVIEDANKARAEKGLEPIAVEVIGKERRAKEGVSPTGKERRSVRPDPSKAVDFGTLPKIAAPDKPADVAPEPPPAAPKKPPKSENLASVINKKFGGIDPKGIEFLANFRSGMGKDFNWPPGLLRKGGKTLDELAAELHNEGIINAPDPNTRVAVLAELLRKKDAQTIRGTEAQAEIAAEADAKAKQLAQDQQLWDMLTAADRKKLPADVLARMKEVGVDFTTKPGGRAVRPESLQGPREGGNELSPSEIGVIDSLDSIRDRDKKIVKAVLGGDSLEAAGKRHALTKGRVEQIMAASWPKLRDADPEAFPWPDYMATKEAIAARDPNSPENAAAARRQMLKEKEEPPDDSFGFGANAYGGFPLPAAMLKAIHNHIFSKPRGADPNFVPDTDTRPHTPKALPSQVVIDEAAGNQLGARNNTLVQRAFTARQYGAHQSRQLGNELEIRLSPIDALWPVDPKTQLSPDGRAWNDVIEAEKENPGSQVLTPDQRRAIEIENDIIEKQVKAMEAEGIVFRDDDGNVVTADEFRKGYSPRTTVPRSALGEAWEELFSGSGKGTPKPGTKPGFTKSRAHETQMEGIKAGVQYEHSFAKRLGKFVADSNLMITDHRLANNPDLGGKDITQDRIKAEMAKAKDVHDALRKAGETDVIEADKRQIVMLATQAAKGNAEVAPAFHGKEYPDDVAREIRRMYGEGPAGPYLKFAQALQQDLRNLVLGLDMSWGMLHLQRQLFTNPKAWGKAMGAGLSEIVSPGTVRRIAERDAGFKKAMSELVQSGGSLEAPENTGGAISGRSLASMVPGVRRFTRAMQSALNVAKVYEWQARRPDDARQWPRMAEAIENNLGMGRMEQLGMSPERAFLERFVFLAPSYYRSHLKLVEQATQGGAPGKYARVQLLAQAAGILATGAAGLYAARAAGVIDDDELKERLDPTKGKFLMVPVPLATGDGKRLEIGIGGVYQSVLRTASQFKEWQKGKEGPNPLVRWYRGHAAVAPRLAWDVLTEKDYQGEPTTPGQAAVRAVLPVAGQQYGQTQGTTGQKLGTAGIGLTGLKAFPESESSERNRALDKEAVRQTGDRWKALSMTTRAKILQKAEAENRLPAEPERTPGQQRARIERAMLNQQNRQKRVNESVSDETRQRAKSLGATIPGYDTSFTIRGVEVPLSPDEVKEYERLIVEEFDRSVDQWPMEKLRASSKTTREKFLEASFSRARERARNRLVREAAK